MADPSILVTEADCLPRLPPAKREGQDRLSKAAEGKLDSADHAGDLGHECRRLKQTADYAQRKSELRSLFLPDGKRIIFASNMDDPKGRNFDLYVINVDGSGLERITDNETFDGFPMFSPDGKKLVFASNRNAKERGETNVFVADWVE